LATTYARAKRHFGFSFKDVIVLEYSERKRECVFYIYLSDDMKLPKIEKMIRTFFRRQYTSEISDPPSEYKIETIKTCEGGREYLLKNVPGELRVYKLNGKRFNLKLFEELDKGIAPYTMTHDIVRHDIHIQLEGTTAGMVDSIHDFSQHFGSIDSLSNIQISRGESTRSFPMHLVCTFEGQSGIQFSDEGVVIEVQPGSEADAKGVIPGWQLVKYGMEIHEANSYPIRFDRDIFEEAEGSGNPYSLFFVKSEVCIKLVAMNSLEVDNLTNALGREGTEDNPSWDMRSITKRRMTSVDDPPIVAASAKLPTKELDLEEAGFGGSGFSAAYGLSDASKVIVMHKKKNIGGSIVPDDNGSSIEMTSRLRNLSPRIDPDKFLSHDEGVTVILNELDGSEPSISTYSDCKRNPYMPMN